MAFRNRAEAAGLLAKKLKKYKGKNPLVLAIPRGAVPMARIISDALDGEMDVVLVHKLRAPYQPEYAIGAIDESGRVYPGKAGGEVGISEAYLREEKEEQMESLRRRRALYTPIHPPVNPAGRIVIIVDDGIATGSSMIAAVESVRTKKPLKVIVAAAVAPFDAVEALRTHADEVECLLVPEMFYAVGEFFEEFPQVSDEEAAALLKREAQSS